MIIQGCLDAHSKVLRSVQSSHLNGMKGADKIFQQTFGDTDPFIAINAVVMFQPAVKAKQYLSGKAVAGNLYRRTDCA